MSKSYQQQWSHKGSIIRRRESKYQVETNYNNKRERKSLNTLAEAKAYASKKDERVNNEDFLHLIIRRKWPKLSGLASFGSDLRT